MDQELQTEHGVAAPLPAPEPRPNPNYESPWKGAPWPQREPAEDVGH